MSIPNKIAGTAGFSLIEVLVSLFLLMIILLSFNVLNFYITALNQSTYFKMMAINQIDGMEERIKALRFSGELNTQIEIWNDENRQILPFSKGAVSGHYPDYTITLTWGRKKEGIDYSFVC